MSVNACHHCLDGTTGPHPECHRMLLLLQRQHQIGSDPDPGEVRRTIGKLASRDFDVRPDQPALDRLLVWTWGMDKAQEIREDRGRGLPPCVADATKGFGD